MSLRRKSCDACFKSRRKCDYGRPACGTCCRTKKSCRYAYASSVKPSNATTTSDLTTWSDDFITAGCSPAASDISFTTFLDMMSNTMPQPFEAGRASTFHSDQHETFSGSRASQSPNQSILLGMSSAQLDLHLVGPLGEVQPIEGSNESWQWVLSQLKTYPSEFAQQAQTLFIHPQLYQKSMPQPIRAAFGMCSACSLINDSNRATFFKIMDTEVVEILNSPEGDAGLFNELARLQALLLYQMMRLFHGGLEHRVLAEQQQVIILGLALKLLTRSRAELDASEGWDSWILAECIRRTALIVYMVYGVNSIFRHGICTEIHTIAKLPLSTAPTCWNSETNYRSHSEPQGTMTYEVFTDSWPVAPRKLYPLERLLLIACRGIIIATEFDDPEAPWF
ncbi:unnamed protein product [Clonostachys rosea f. rosea IK726]|uniref:Zn(2)-C6 fungal-type domain-containing protein n=2 Tax=Bionectria ochroleuca TaxID=29856 RepID=A0A8H7KFF9_BIOOC|nr:unnamed protein product [Clonostachys rosea f. rosea IK726]